MNVHVVASSGELGGAELALLTFLEHRPQDVAATATVIGEGPLAAALERAGVPAEQHPELTGRPAAPAALRFSRALARRLRAERPDVVWLAGQKAAALGAPAARLARVPAVWHKVDFTRDDLLARPLGALAGRVIAVS